MELSACVKPRRVGDQKSAYTCSTRERTFYSSALARRAPSGIGLSLGLLR